MSSDGTPAGLVLDPTTATALLERVLGGDGAVTASAGPFSEVECGVLAYGLARWLTAAPHRWCVATVFAYPAALFESLLGGGPPELVQWPMELQIGQARGIATLWLSEPAGQGPVAALSPPLPGWASQLPVVLSAVAGCATLSIHQLSSLRPGDVVLPERLRVTLGPRGLDGHVELTPRGSSRGMQMAVSEGKMTFERAWTESALHAGSGRGEDVWGQDMQDEDRDRALKSLEDVPVKLSLELARFELRLADVLALSSGEVLCTGRPLGTEVHLRAGEHVIASGELVEVDGEVGIRIHELLPASLEQLER